MPVQLPSIDVLNANGGQEFKPSPLPGHAQAERRLLEQLSRHVHAGLKGKLRHTPVRRGNRGGPAADTRSPTAYHAVVSFYMLSYQLSEGDDSEVIAEATSAQLLRTFFQVSSLLFNSLIIE